MPFGLQIAPNVRVDISRAAIVGYQGQTPVADAPNSINHGEEPALETPRHPRASSALAVFAFYPPDQKVQLGLDLKGGVHLVLRVQTDDALRLETQTTADRLGEQLKTANVTISGYTVNGPTAFTVSGVAPEQDARSAAALTEVEVNYNRSSSAGGSYTFTLKPNIVVQLREDTVNQALQTIERRVNELGVAEPIVARHSAADQILVQLPGVTDVARAKEIIRSTAQLELKQVEQGPFSDEAAARQALGNNVPPDMQILPGTMTSAAPGQPPGTGYLRGPPRSGRHRPRPAQRASHARREQPSGRELLAQQRWRAQVRRLHAGQHRPPARRSCSTAASMSAPHDSVRASTTRAASPATSRTRKRRTCRWCCVRARCRRT